MFSKYQITLCKLFRIDMLTVTQKLRILTIFFVCILSIMVGYTSFTLLKQKSDGMVVNIAGRQRMLTQKFTKEFFLALQQGKKQSDNMLNTGKLFDISLKALTHGGQTYKDINMSDAIQLDGTTDQVILAQLVAAADIWRQLQAAITNIGETNYSFKQLNTINDLSVRVLQAMNKAVGMLAEKADAKVTTLQVTLAVLWFIAIFLSLTTASIIVTSVTTPIEHLIQVSRQFAGGDLTSKKEGAKIHGEMSILSANMHKMRLLLSNIIQKMQQNVQQMIYSSRQIANISTEITKSNENENKSSQLVLEATESLQEISETVNNEIDEAKDGVELTKKHAQKGITVVHQNITELSDTVASVNATADQMEELKKATEHIHKIIVSIQDIADQTNLLSLNATIEAARAGDAGKGFAVVASEIKELAKQTAHSTTEISDLINELTSQVDNSVTSMQQVVQKVHKSQEQSQATVNAFEEMTEDVDRTMTTTNALSEYNQQQATQLENLHQQLQALFSVLKKNTQKADDTAMVATSLSMVADKILASLTKFVVDPVDAAKRQAEEKRLFPRHDNNIRCTVQQGDEFVNGVSRDISITGMLLQCPEKLKHDGTLSIQLFLPQEHDNEKQEQLHITADVKREFSKDGYHQYGLNFAQQDGREQQTMERIITYFKKQSHYT